MLKHQKKGIYKALSMLLAAVLMLAMLPVMSGAAGAPAFAEGYPKPGTTQADGSKTIKVLVKGALPDGETSMGLGYVLLADGDPAPSAEQIRSAYGKIPGVTVITWAQQILGDTETPITLTGAQDDTDYEFYAVCWVGDVFSEIRHLDVKTPAGSGDPDAMLAPPTGVQWDTADGIKAKWNAVTSATSYAVTLYKEGNSTYLIQYTVTDTEVSFQSSIGGYTGNYFFTVQAKADGYISSLKPASLFYSHIAPLLGTATIDNMSPKVGDTLNGSLVYGNNTGTLQYVWKAGGSQVGTDAASYTVTADDLGKTITLEISSSVETGTKTSTATAAVLPAAQLGKPTGLAWDTSAEQLKATWTSVPNAEQYKVEYYKDGSKLDLSTNVNAPDTSTDDMKDNLLVLGVGEYTFTVQATRSGYTDSEISEPSDSYSYTSGGTTYIVTVNGSYASLTGSGSYAAGSTVSIYAGNRSSYTFAGWSSSDVAITNAGQKNASFTMPGKAVTVTANWSYNGGAGLSYIDASVSTAKADYLKYGGKDVTTILFSGSYTLKDLKNGSYTLKKGTDYTVSGSTIAIKAGYLDSLTVGKQVITFDMSGGADPVLTITIEHIPFEDVTVGDWFVSNVMWAFDSGLMKGISETPMRFDPHGTTTRGMIVTILHRIESAPATGATNPFEDVAEGKWYTDAIIWAANNKIVSGYGNGRFGADDPITREQMAVILMNYAKLKGYDVTARADLSGFIDADTVTGWALEAMSWANAAGLIQGDGTKLTPTGNAERCQVAAILQRFVQQSVA